jgi:hypothetical protein
MPELDLHATQSECHILETRWFGTRRTRRLMSPTSSESPKIGHDFMEIVESDAQHT